MDWKMMIVEFATRLITRLLFAPAKKPVPPDYAAVERARAAGKGASEASRVPPAIVLEGIGILPEGYCQVNLSQGRFHASGQGPSMGDAWDHAVDQLRVMRGGR